MCPAAYSGGDSSAASSAESNFRELDDVFLQTQTRIWLGEILHRRLDEELSISDLLADGELLFEVSNVVWNILLAKCVELRHLKAHRCKPISSGKVSGRYLPYSYVDSFLKVCKVLGMNGIDLFSPSDVVEKRNVRKVCICIRSLSKKARSKQLNVPDFDVVTNTVYMPTDMVGYIRRSLEQSQWSSTSSSSYSSYKDSKSNYKKKNSATACDGNYESCSEESDEVQSNYTINQFCNSYGNNSEDIGTSNLDKENSSGFSSVATNYTSVQSMRQARDLDEFESGQYKSTCLGEPEPVSLVPRYLKNEHPLDSMSSSRTSCIKPQKELCDQLLPVNNWSKNSYKSGPLDLVDIDSNFHNDESILGDFMDENRAERSCITHHLELETDIPTLFDEDDSVFNLFMGSDSHGSSASHRVHQNGIRIYSDDVEDMEVSSTTSMSSVLCRMLDSDFDDQFDADDFRTTIVNAIDLMHDRSENLGNSFVKEHDAQYKTKYEKSVESLTPDSEEFQIQVLPHLSGVSTRLFPMCPDDWQPHSIDHQDTSLKNEVVVSQSDLKDPLKMKNSELITLERVDDTILEKNGVVIQEISSQEGKAKNPRSTVRYSAKVNDTIHGNYSGENEVICQVTNVKEERKHEDASIFLEDILDKREDASAGPHKAKSKGKQMLKTVVKGTALVGIMLFLLHLRSRRGGDKKDEANKPSSQIQKSNGRKLSPQKGPREGKVNGIYHAEKLKFGI